MASEQQLSDVLSEFARTMVTDFPIQRILDHLVLRIVEIMPVSAAGVTLISPPSSPRYVAASDASALRYEELQTELGEGPCLAAYRSGKAVSVPDMSKEDRFRLFVPRALEAGLGAAFTFPLHQGDSRLGALDLYRDTPGPLNADDMVKAQTLADVTAAYLVNAQARDELQDSSERSHQSSMHDGLTGLPNRALLLERLEHATLRSRRSNTSVAVLFIDLDEFKDINDVHGHQIGDELLIAVADRIAALLRPGDTLARLSGDEFVILCEELDSERRTDMIATRLLSALAVPFVLSGVEVKVSASVGIAFAGHGAHNPGQLLHDADMAMYQVKRKGGAAHQVVDLREQRIAVHRASLARDMEDAMARHELRIAYQPIVRTSDGQVTGAEALVRWDHPTQGPIPAKTLIPLSEKSGLIIEMGRMVLERACTDLRRWAGDHADGSFGIAVNVSARQLMAPEFVATVTDVLTHTDTAPQLLTLEMTESVFVQDAERALVVLTELKRLGIKLALDDFGTGYSSLSYLNRFPVDIVKIDQGFITNMAHDTASHAIVSTMIELAHMLDLKVITEGVETVEQHSQITALGSESCQGYYFARPMTPEALDTLMHDAATGVSPTLPILAVA